MAQSSGDGTGWTADKSKGPMPKDWTWSYKGVDPWGIQRSARRDEESLMKWMQAMSEWGSQVATKCRDLEERVRYLERHLQEHAAPKGGKAS